MKQIDFYFDFLSPYAHLAFEKLPDILLGLSYEVTYKPVLLGAILQHHGQLGPAEIAPKRDWTYRQASWQAHAHGVALQMPARHPFNPIPLLRLALACATHGAPNRYVVETIFRHVWHGGADASDPQRLQQLTRELAPQRALDSADVKAELRTNTDAAIALGLFGVPTMVVDGKSFWGFDALPMLRDFLDGGAWFEGDAWDAAARLPVGVTRLRP